MMGGSDIIRLIQLPSHILKFNTEFNLKFIKGETTCEN